MFNIIIDPVCGPKKKGVLHESGLIHLEEGEFSHIQHEKFMGRSVSIVVNEEENLKPTTAVQSETQPKPKTKRK